MLKYKLSPFFTEKIATNWGLDFAIIFAFLVFPFNVILTLGEYLNVVPEADERITIPSFSIETVLENLHEDSSLYFVP